VAVISVEMAVDILYNNTNQKRCDKGKSLGPEVDMPGKRMSDFIFGNSIFQYAGLFLTVNSFALAVIIVVIYLTSGPLKIKPVWILIFLAFMLLSLLKTFVPVCPDCKAPLDVGFITQHLFSTDRCWCCGRRSHKAEPDQ
jgi:hypothetical protein